MSVKNKAKSTKKPARAESKKTKQRCGKCHKAGHNARTCEN